MCYVDVNVYIKTVYGKELLWIVFGKCKMPMQITIKEVAQKAGVSIATVSRAVNNSKKIDPETRKKVLTAIKELNYQPSIIARSLVSGETNILALFIPHVENFANPDYFHKIVSGITAAVTEREYDLLIRQLTVNDGFRHTLLDSHSDGFIIIAPTFSSPILKELEITQRPTVIVNGRSSYLNWVDLDNVSAGLQATEHLIKLGHKKIMFIGGLENSQNTQDRFKGCQLAFEKHELVFNPDLVFYAYYHKAEAYEIIKNMNLNKITAIFACNDLMAIGAISAIKEKGLRVPEDIAIVGFDDIEIAESFEPTITTIKQPLIKIGETAVELLIDQIEKNKEKPEEIRIRSVELQGELIIRKSCGAKQ